MNLLVGPPHDGCLGYQQVVRVGSTVLYILILRVQKKCKKRRSFYWTAEPFALASYVALLEREARGAPWMIAGHEVDLRNLIQPTVEAVGHVRVGLEDAPFGSEMTNLDWVRSAASLIKASGRRLASASEIRAATSTRTA